MRVCVGYSGGKDSSTASILYLESGFEVTLLCYVPYLTDDIPLVPINRIDYLYRVKNFYESLGAKFIIVRGISYYDWCMRTLKSGINKGKIQGFPVFLRNKCGFARDSKIKSCEDFLALHSNDFDFIDISYTADENRGILSGKKVSILQQRGFTQFDTMKFVQNYKHGILYSPSYETGLRDGCSLCPHAKAVERYLYFDDYPEAVPIVEEMQRRILSERGFYPLRHKRFFVEDEEFVSPNGSNISIFGKYYN